MASSDTSASPVAQDSREALLDATERVIARKGFSGLTYRSVAAEAGVTHGLVTYHFGTLDALISETMLRAVRQAVDGSALEARSGRIEDFARDLGQLAEDEPDGQAFQFEVVLEARRRSELLGEVQSMYDNYFAVVQEALGRIGVDDSRAMTRLVFAALDGMILQQLIFGSREDTDELVDKLHDVLRVLAAARANGSPDQL
jgi:AcrR family transcriptional regulator